MQGSLLLRQACGSGSGSGSETTLTTATGGATATTTATATGGATATATGATGDGGGGSGGGGGGAKRDANSYLCFLLDILGSLGVGLQRLSVAAEAEQSAAEALQLAPAVRGIIRRRIAAQKIDWLSPPLAGTNDHASSANGMGALHSLQVLMQVSSLATEVVAEQPLHARYMAPAAPTATATAAASAAATPAAVVSLALTGTPASAVSAASALSLSCEPSSSGSVAVIPVATDILEQVGQQEELLRYVCN